MPCNREVAVCAILLKGRCLRLCAATRMSETIEVSYTYSVPQTLGLRTRANCQTIYLTFNYYPHDQYPVFLASDRTPDVVKDNCRAGGIYLEDVAHSEAVVVANRGCKLEEGRVAAENVHIALEDGVLSVAMLLGRLAILCLWWDILG